MFEISPVIELGPDSPMYPRMKAKLAEYVGRFEPYQAPELQMDTICKVTVLERVLAQGRVVTHDLSREMAERFGTGFSAQAFINACGVINDYITTGGAHVSGGTGLPAVH